MQDPSTAFLPIKPPFPEQEQLKCPRCESSNTKFCYYNNYNLSQPRHFCKNCRRYWTKGGSLRNIPVGGSTRKGNKRNSSNSKHANPDHAPESTRTVPRRATDSPVSSSSTPVAATSAELTGNRHPGTVQDPTFMYGLESRPERKILDMSGRSFSSLLAPSEQLGSIFEGVSSDGSGFKMVPLSGYEDLKSNLSAGPGQDPGLDLGGGGSNKNNGGSGAGAGAGVGAGEGYLQSGDWGSSNGWPDLAIYTPGSSFQ